jgi:hypothetical protein
MALLIGLATGLFRIKTPVVNPVIEAAELTIPVANPTPILRADHRRSILPGA